jgi:hypothetical protein
MNEEKTIKKFFQNRDVLKWVIIGLVGFAMLILVFGAGVKVGTMKAMYSYRWAENYHKNFGGPREGFLFLSDNKGGFVSSHGAVGQIIKIDDNALIVKDREITEKSVLVKEDTTILRLREEIQLSDLKVDDFIVVIGDPNDAGQVEAKLIRVMPSPPAGDSPQFLIRRLPR